MVYCKTSDVRAMLKDDALGAIIGERRKTPVIRKAIADACAEIDGYLAKRCTVPLNPVPEVIAKYAKDIAVYNLYSRIGIDESGGEKNYLHRYRAAIRYLELVAGGKVELGVAGTAASARTDFAVRSARRVFSRDSMRGL